MSRLCVFVVLVVIVAVAVVQSEARRGCKPTGPCANKPCQNGGTCVDENKTFKCVCPPEYTGNLCEVQIPRCTTTPNTTGEPHRIDCQAWKEAGAVNSGVYTIWPGGKAVAVRCDMKTDGGGWTVFQSRGNYSVQENFNRNWTEYKDGFGCREKDHWLGLEYISALSSKGDYYLRLDMTAANGTRAFAVLRTFSVADESSKYRLLVGNYEKNGTAGVKYFPHTAYARTSTLSHPDHTGLWNTGSGIYTGYGDSMSYSNKESFSTRDMDNDKTNEKNCAVDFQSGFWYFKCAECNPNGLYLPGLTTNNSIMYYHSFQKFVGLSSFEMKLKKL